MASAGFRDSSRDARSADGWALAVCALRGEVKRVFELACFDTAYPIFETRREALEFCGSQAGPLMTDPSAAKLRREMNLPVAVVEPSAWPAFKPAAP
jgi:hypothetical protein